MNTSSYQVKTSARIGGQPGTRKSGGVQNVIHHNSAMSGKFQYNKYGITRNASEPSSSGKNHKGKSNDERKEKTRMVSSEFRENDYSNNYIINDETPLKYIRNIEAPTEGYPKLSKLKQLKSQQMQKHSVDAYGCKVETQDIIPVLNKWINRYNLQFDVIMIGALVENQFILPILLHLPIYKLCAKPGFVFIWSTTEKIHQLSKLLNSENWNKKFRRSEELVFVPVDENSPFFPKDFSDEDKSQAGLFERKQWHCWMCITGTVRRSNDSHLIHCNIDTDLQIESPTSAGKFNNAVPEELYKVTENFSNSNRRLHIIPSRTGYKFPVRLRRGWIIMSPDVLADNFKIEEYEAQLYAKSTINYKSINNKTMSLTITQYLVPQTQEIEELRPKSPANESK